MVLKRSWVDAHFNKLLTIQARELTFFVRYMREKSAYLADFQPKAKAYLVILLIFLQGVIAYRGGGAEVVFHYFHTLLDIGGLLNIFQKI